MQRPPLPLLGPGLARRRWEHLATRILRETRKAAIYTAYVALDNWTTCIRELQAHWRATLWRYATYRAAEFYRARALRRRVLTLPVAARAA